MSAPLKTAEEISLIINRGQHAIADIGLSLTKRGKRGVTQSDTAYRDDMYRLILLRIYLQNILDDDGEVIEYYTAEDNLLRFNELLDAIARLSQFYGGAAIPLLTGKRIPLTYYPSTASNQGSPNNGGPANPGGVTFQNLNVQSPGEVVDTMDASSSEYAFYIINIRGTGTGEGSRLDILGVNWRGAANPVITNYRGSDVGGTVGDAVTYSAAIVDGQLQLTCNVPTDGWIVRGSRISFENISFQNAQGPLPAGGTEGQYLRKSSSENYDAEFAAIVMSEVTGLIAALATKLAHDGSIPMSGDLPAGGFKLTGLGAGAAPGESLRYEQVIGVFLQLIGGTMSGNIAMGGNKVTGLGAASGNGEAVRYEQAIKSGDAAGGDLTGTFPNPTLSTQRVKSVGAQLITQVIEIGDWNMDTTPGVTIDVEGAGISIPKIRTIQGVIRSDADAAFFPLGEFPIPYFVGGANILRFGVAAIGFGLFIAREDAGYFDSTDFDSTGFNRGWVVITYEE